MSVLKELSCLVFESSLDMHHLCGLVADEAADRGTLAFPVPMLFVKNKYWMPVYIVKLLLQGWMWPARKARRTFVKSLYNEFDNSAVSQNCPDRDTPRRTTCPSHGIDRTVLRSDIFA